MATNIVILRWLNGKMAPIDNHQFGSGGCTVVALLPNDECKGVRMVYCCSHFRIGVSTPSRNKLVPFKNPGDFVILAHKIILI